MERAVEILAVVHFVIVGLSHALRPRMWVEFFSWLHARGHAGVMVHGFLSLGFGSVIVAFHPVWRGLPAVLTVVGWVYLVKASLCFLLPETQMRTLGRVAPERAWELRLPGFAFLALGAALAYHLWAGQPT
jgi:uncharacterized protein YjeT (DUF2065 family)